MSHRFALHKSMAIAASILCSFAAVVAAQENNPLKSQFDLFAKTLTGAKFSGSFTRSGQDFEHLTRDEYHILECKKLDEGNLWMIKARIKYGDHDVTVPMPLPIEWADTTPVISLNDFSIPLLGTFDAHVVIDLEHKKYAGTWSHGEVCGHLFGDILPGEANPNSNSKSPPTTR